MGARRKDHSGKKYGMLTMLQFSHGRGAGRHALWMARCDCGNVVEIIGMEAERGSVKSCGKHEVSRDLTASPPLRIRQYSAPLRRAYSRLSREAVDRGRPMHLLPEEFKVLTLCGCALCGAAPIQTRKVPGNKLILKDGTGNYTQNNLVSICPTCFEMGKGLSLLERLGHLAKIYANLRPPQ
jgi:hypothetical protein